MTNSESADPAVAETAAGAVQGGGDQDATEGESGTGEFVVDHDADPPEEVQPTTS